MLSKESYFFFKTKVKKNITGPDFNYASLYRFKHFLAGLYNFELHLN